MAKEKGLYQVTLKVLLENDNGETLVLKAPNSGNYAGYCDLPGGRIDEDELDTDLIQILSREIREEVGDIRLKINKKPVSVFRNFIPAEISVTRRDINVLHILFEAQYLGGEIIISHEHAGYQWLDLTKVELSDFFVFGLLEGIKTYLEGGSGQKCLKDCEK